MKNCRIATDEELDGINAEDILYLSMGDLYADGDLFKTEERIYVVDICEKDASGNILAGVMFLTWEDEPMELISLIQADEIKDIIINPTEEEEFKSWFKITNGKLFAKGDNSFGQLGQGDTFDRLIYIDTGIKDVEGLKYKDGSTFIKLKDGTQKAAGKNDRGQLYLGDTYHRNIFIEMGQQFDWQPKELTNEKLSAKFKK